MTIRKWIIKLLKAVPQEDVQETISTALEKQRKVLERAHETEMAKLVAAQEKLNAQAEIVQKADNNLINELGRQNKDEHENYLAMLKCQNAAAEYQQKIMLTPAEHAKEIQDYCKGRKNCEGCGLNGDAFCKTSYTATPESWDI